MMVFVVSACVLAMGRCGCEGVVVVSGERWLWWVVEVGGGDDGICGESSCFGDGSVWL